MNEILKYGRGGWFVCCFNGPKPIQELGPMSKAQAKRFVRGYNLVMPHTYSADMQRGTVIMENINEDIDRQLAAYGI
jgi:hypothetical protein